ncbi:MAG TPA: hypothetical protein VNY31_01640 [Solirubrobacteraceae bacterium]|jgi:hypothetical protein|nr:hypothetical protein [Solirubrobacteraceae bacterium]
MAVEIKPVASRGELNEFIKLPWQLYRGEPNWVPPLLMDVRKRLDRKRNPFFEHAEGEYFLAWRDGRPVGRVSAHIDGTSTSSRKTHGAFGGGLSARTIPRPRVRYSTPPRDG